MARVGRGQRVKWSRVTEPKLQVLQVLQDPLDDVGIVDECNDAQSSAAG